MALYDEGGLSYVFVVVVVVINSYNISYLDLI